MRSYYFALFFFLFDVAVTSGSVDKNLQHTGSPPKDIHPEDNQNIGTTLVETLHEIGFSQVLTVIGDPIVEKESKFQDILVYNTPHFGKVLVLDDVLQLTEQDAASYNEMMAHIPMMEHPAPKRVLVIGGGDGYVLHEVLKHETVIEVDHVDLDKDVVDVCKEHFSWGKAWDDDRVTLHIANGATFVEKVPDGYYDVVIQDSSDPFTIDENGESIDLPSGALYSDDHFAHIRRILSENGIFNFQAETFNLPSDLNGICAWRRKALKVGFKKVRYGSLYITTYPTGQIGFLMCKKNGEEVASEELIRSRFERIEKAGKVTKYYQPSLQRSSFDLPLWVSKSIYDRTEAECVADSGPKNNASTKTE